MPDPTYKYFLGDEVFVYPSANAKDGGNINTEVNMASLAKSVVTKDFIISYKLRDPSATYESLEVTDTTGSGWSGTNFNLYSGEVFIAGRWIKLTFDSSGSPYTELNLADLYDGDISSISELHLVLVIFTDSGNVVGDDLNNTPVYCYGVGLTAVTDTTGLSNYIELGTFGLTSGSITGYEVNNSAYTSITTGAVEDKVYICNSAANAPIKVINEATGTSIKVKFSNANTKNSPITLSTENLSGIIYCNKPSNSGGLAYCTWYNINSTSQIYEFVYEGGVWILLNPLIFPGEVSGHSTLGLVLPNQDPQTSWSAAVLAIWSFESDYSQLTGTSILVLLGNEMLASDNTLPSLGNGDIVLGLGLNGRLLPLCDSKTKTRLHWGLFNRRGYTYILEYHPQGHDGFTEECFGVINPASSERNETTYTYTSGGVTTTGTVYWSCINSIVTLNMNTGNLANNAVTLDYSTGPKLPAPYGMTMNAASIPVATTSLTLAYISPDRLLLPANTTPGSYNTSYII